MSRPIPFALLIALVTVGCKDRPTSDVVDPDDLAVGVDEPSPELAQRQRDLDDRLDALAKGLATVRADLEKREVPPPDVTTKELTSIEAGIALTRDDVASLGASGDAWPEDARAVEVSVDALQERLDAVEAQAANGPTDHDGATADGN